jgi:hypothetical protein
MMTARRLFAVVATALLAGVATEVARHPAHDGSRRPGTTTTAEPSTSAAIVRTDDTHAATAAEPAEDARGRAASADGPRGRTRPSRHDWVQQRVRSGDATLALGARRDDDGAEFGTWVKAHGSREWRFTPLEATGPFADVPGAAWGVRFVGAGTIATGTVVIGQASLGFDLGEYLRGAAPDLVGTDAPVSITFDIPDSDATEPRILVRPDGERDEVLEVSLEDVGLDRGLVRETTSGGHPIVWVGDERGRFREMSGLVEQTGLRVVERASVVAGEVVVVGKDAQGGSAVAASRDGGTWMRRGS